MYSATIYNLAAQNNSTGTPLSNGLQLGGLGYTDVLHSHFANLYVAGNHYGTFLDSTGGCVCYNDFTSVDSSGAVAGIKTQNDSSYTFGVNSNRWTGGRIYGPIGLWDTGTAKFTFSYLDFESNASSTGAILYAGPDGNNAGTGYVTGDTVRPAGGDSAAVLTVTASGGAVTALTVTTPGTTYTNIGSTTTTTLTGIGTGLRVDLVISAYQLLLSNAGTTVINPYEEAGAADYICGTGNMVQGAWGSISGGVYSPRYCTGPTNQYGGPASNFIWGTSSTPHSIGLAGGYQNSSYIAMSSSTMYDANLVSAFKPGGSYTTSINLWSDGPAFNGTDTSTYGRYGHSPWYVGLSGPRSGTDAYGKTNYLAISNPSAPTCTATGGTGTGYTYAVVGYDLNGGVTLPSSFCTVSGPATLSSSAYITITPPQIDGIICWDTLKTNTGTILPGPGGGLEVCPRSSASMTRQDQGQSTVAFSAPARNTTADFQTSGYVTFGGINGVGTKGPVCADATGLLYIGNNTGTGAPCP